MSNEKWWAIIQVADERERAHAKHGKTSMRTFAINSQWGDCLAILGEEYGEVCRLFNDARHRQAKNPSHLYVDPEKLAGELIQLAAMASEWASLLPDGS